MEANPQFIKHGIYHKPLICTYGFERLADDTPVITIEGSPPIM